MVVFDRVMFMLVVIVMLEYSECVVYYRASRFDVYMYVWLFDFRPVLIFRHVSIEATMKVVFRYKIKQIKTQLV